MTRRRWTSLLVGSVLWIGTIVLTAFLPDTWWGTMIGIVLAVVAILIVADDSWWNLVMPKRWQRLDPTSVAMDMDRKMLNAVALAVKLRKTDPEAAKRAEAVAMHYKRLAETARRLKKK